MQRQRPPRARAFPPPNPAPDSHPIATPAKISPARPRRPNGGSASSARRTPPAARASQRRGGVPQYCASAT
eukprot:8797019-Lingulodinium_polyedra.AAC.2